MKHTVPIFNFHLVADRKKFPLDDFQLLNVIDDFDVYEHNSIQGSYVLYYKERKKCFRVLCYDKKGTDFEKDLMGYIDFYIALVKYKKRSKH